MSDIFIDREQIKISISKLSSKSGPGTDGVYCLKNGGNFVLDAIEDLAKCSLKLAYIPQKLRPVWVTPIWKKTDRELASEYRPISITNHILKIIEWLISKQMTDFFTVNNMISSDQHGGRAGHSTFTQLISQHETILESLTQGNNLDIVYLDFTKTFDLVDISVLLSKLKILESLGPCWPG